jgi:diacylglycerol kinase family enzyme
VLLGRVEVGEKGGVLREVRLELLEPGLEPVLEPGLAELVLYAVKAAVAHGFMIGTERRRRNEPFGLTCSPFRPIASSSVRGFLLINPRAGTERPTTVELENAAQAHGVDVHVLREGDDPAALARKADTEVLGVAGGDGSVASVAAVAVERDLPLVVVPYGTRNHFARDLGLDRTDPLAALEAFDGPERRVDVGRAGERRFLNNVSLGAYATLVHRREHNRRRREALAGLRALWIGLRERQNVWASVNGEPVRGRVLLVANNAYELSLFSIGERARLDEGRLHLYTANGLLPDSWQERSGTRFELDAPTGRLEAAVDGEAVVLEMPLELAVEPGALRALLPSAPGR